MGAEVQLLVLSRGGLKAKSRAFDEDRVGELRLEAGAEGCERGRVIGDFERHALAKGDWRSLALESSQWVEAPAPEGWSVLVPTLGDRCWSRPVATLRAVGRDPWLLGPGTPVGESNTLDVPGFGRLARAEALDERHVLALSEGALFVFERGEPWENQPTRLLVYRDMARELGETAGSFADFEIDRASADEAPRLVVAFNRDNLGGQGSIATMTWHESTGFGAPERRLDVPDGLHRMTQTIDGAWVAVGDSGRVVFGRFDGLEMETHQIPNAGDLRDILISGDSAQPHIAVDTQLGLHFGDARAKTWRSEPSGSLFGGLGGAAVRQTEGGLEVYLSPFGPAATVRRPDGIRRAFPLWAPESTPFCASGSDGKGRPSLAPNITEIELTPGGSLLFEPATCGALIEVDPDRGCTRAMLLPATTAEERQRVRLTRMGTGLGRLFVVGFEGLLLEAEWP